MNKIIIKVNGMMCEGCENRIKNTLNSIDGVENVEANHLIGIIEVLATENISKNYLEEKIEDIGFEVVGINVDNQ